MAHISVHAHVPLHTANACIDNMEKGERMRAYAHPQAHLLTRIVTCVSVDASARMLLTNFRPRCHRERNADLALEDDNLGVRRTCVDATRARGEASMTERRTRRIGRNGGGDGGNGDGNGGGCGGR
eukprot:5024349-Pleurochrysis_carterae.AAC.4